LKEPIGSTINTLQHWLGEHGARLPWRARWTFMGLPPRCYFCQAEGDLGPIDLCSKCCSELPWCSENEIGASSLSALDYRDPVDQALKALKYGGDRCAARLFGGLLAAAAREAERPDVLIPVPLHPERVCSRGFNQSSLIATCVGEWLHRPVHLDGVLRTRATPSQTGLHAAERRRNVEDAFIVAPGLQQELEASGVRRVALIDDVVTTGATLDAARNALLETGVTDVQRWAVARAIPAKSTMPT
jgi:ComF family protein